MFKSEALRNCYRCQVSMQEWGRVQMAVLQGNRDPLAFLPVGYLCRYQYIFPLELFSPQKEILLSCSRDEVTIGEDK